MTNTLASPTMGFQLFDRNGQSAPTGGQTAVWIASTDASQIFRGDPIVTSSAGGTNNSGAYITAPASGNGFIRGVFQGCFQYQPSAGRVVWSNFYNGSVTGSTGDVKCYIVDDPDALFLVQGSTGGTISSSLVGLNFGFTMNSSTGNTTTGYSNVALQSTTFGSTATYPWRVVDFFSAYAPGVGNGPVNYNSSVSSPLINGTDNSNPANMVIVRLNNCDRMSLTAKST
ncbi:MAG TPA: hypothetical protein VJ777_21725 [Mycobacterium sp.]|nr:hypothetical protein [Mycobacterium sp.]